MTTLIIIIAVVMVLALAGFLVWRSRTANPEVTAARQEVAQRSKALKAAKAERDQAITGAQRQLNDAQKKYQQYVSSAKQKLNQLTDPKGKRLGSYHGVTLYERWIQTPHGNGRVAGTVASVDSQVSSRITATRLVTLGVFALAAKKKTGAIYLSIDNPELASVVECPKDDQLKARQFAVQITNAGKAAEAIEARLPAQIEQARADVHAAETATKPIQFAKEELDAVTENTAMLEAIQSAEAALLAARAKLAALTGKGTLELDSATDA